MDWIMAIDTALLRILNVQCPNSFFDHFIPLFSDIDKWKIPLFLFLLFIVIKERWKGALIVAGLGLTIVLSETMSTQVVKELVDRSRPCHIHEWVRSVGHCPKSPSFTSTHAANIFAATTFLSFFFTGWRFPMLAVAILVGYSRVYKGVHYPFDVLGGAILGVGCAWAVFILFRDFVLPKTGIKLKDPSSIRKREIPGEGDIIDS